MSRPTQLAPQFPVLDTLRAVGAVAVVTTHTTYQSGDYDGNGIWGSLFSRLDVGVAIFFVLSGFLLSRPYFARAELRRPSPSIGPYYWKRWLRVYPVYALTVAIALALIPENDGLGAAEWIHTLLLLDIYTEDRLPQGLTQMWSLAVEVSFYLLLPLLAFVVRGPLSPRRVAGLLAALVALSCWWHLDLAARVSHGLPGQPLQWLPSYLSWFAIGIALAFLHVAWESSACCGRIARGLALLGRMPGVCWALVAGLMLVAATPVAGPTTFLFIATSGESLTKSLLYTVIGGLAVLTGVFADPSGRYAAVMSAPLLRHLGHTSYSVFCIHLPLLYLVMAVADYPLFEGHGVQIWALTLGLSMAAAEVLYRCVERPAMRLRNLGRSSGDVDQPRTTDAAATTRY